MKLKWFEMGTLVLSVMGYVLMFAGFAAVKGLVPETFLKLENVSWSLFVCTVLLLACEIMACQTVNVMFKTEGQKTVRTKLMWMRTAAVAVLLFMFAVYQIPLIWYMASGQYGLLAVFIKVAVPILTAAVFLFVVLYFSRERRRLVYV